MASLFKEMKADAILATADEIAQDDSLGVDEKLAKYDEVDAKIAEIIPDDAQREDYYDRKQAQKNALMAKFTETMTAEQLANLATKAQA